MKAVLISIQPKWCEKIARGKKTVEVRKSRPKLETPFKVYIYCTKGRGDCLWEWCGDISYDTQFPNERPNRLDGKVIGEFVCDKITPLFNVAITSWELLAGNVHEYAKGLVRMARLTEKEMHEYAKGKNCFAWHISNLKIYDKPKELIEFKKPCPYTDGTYCLARKCEHYDDYSGKCCNRVERPPQSWCYVEELKNALRI